MKEQLISEVLELVLGLIAAIVTGVLLPKLAQLVTSKVQNETLNNVVFDLSNSAAVVVNYLEQTMVSQLKKDGKWNSETQKEVLDKAVELVLERLADKTISTLDKNSTNVTNLIVSYIEAYINGTHSPTPVDLISSQMSFEDCGIGVDGSSGDPALVKE